MEARVERVVRKRVEPQLGLDPLSFVFGGVAFDVCPARELTWALTDEHRGFVADYATSPVAGLVHCSVSSAAELADDHRREIEWSWDGDVAQISTGRLRAELRWLGGAHYAARAQVAPDTSGCTSLCTAIAAAVVNHRGGLVLHAAGVELDGRAVLFVGPSGAGKTTAANHCAGTRWMARDRAAIYPTPLGWYAAGMAGGDPIELPRADARVAPLAGIFRVRHATELMIGSASGAKAIAILRESVQAPPATLEAELLGRIASAADEGWVGVASTVLGRDLSDELRNALRRS